MAARTQLPRYIPPPTTFLLSRSGATYGIKLLPNKHWNTVRDNVQNNGLRNGGTADVQNSYDRQRYGPNQQTRPQAQEKLQRPPTYVNGPKNVPSYERQQQNGGRINSRGNKHGFLDDDDSEVQKIEHQEFHDAKPDYDRLFEEADEIYENRGKKDGDGSKRSDASEAGNGSSREGMRRRINKDEGYDDDYNGDVDWQKKTEKKNDGKYDWSKNRRRSNSVYDPESTKMRTQEIDQQGGINRGKTGDWNGAGNGGLRERKRGMATPETLEPTNTGNKEVKDTGLGSGEDSQPSTSGSMEEERDSVSSDIVNDDDDDDKSSESSGDEDEEENEGEGSEKESGKGKKCKIKKLKDMFKKCTPKFAEKLLDAIEKRKSDCRIPFDEICKKYKRKNGDPIFTSYSCENGDTKSSFKDSMKKRLRSLVGGFYTKACEGIEKVKDAAEDWLDEIKPKDDGTWSQVEGEHGIRCVAHYDNQIEDSTVYVCSCCFNEVIDRDVHVNVKYFDAQFGCCKPKVVLRSFENRPYYCEKILASMSEKRREWFLKHYGKKHNMRGGVHCISVIPSMEADFLAQQSNLENEDNEEDENVDEEGKNDDGKSDGEY